MVLGLITALTAVAITTDTADARRRHGSRHHHAKHVRASSYNPPFSSIIVDANSGAVLDAKNADSLRYPASLTKIMTLYLLFEQLEAGKLRLDSEMQVSLHASQQAPTKLGLRPGQTIEVEDAIKGLVTRSANDAAVVIGEAIGGDEDDFAKLMTRKARALGMTRTVYRNASGLPNDEQVTTARDQALLGRAIQDRFPRYYRYFSTAEFRFRGHVIRNHNHLIGSVEGVDGIKTGYTLKSGFNLVTSIRRGNRHLVGVVLGGRSYRSRDNTMRTLLAEHLNEGATRRTVAAITERTAPDSATFDPRIVAEPKNTAAREVASANDLAGSETDSEGNISRRPAEIKLASATSEPVNLPPQRPAAAPQRPAPFTNGVLAPRASVVTPGSTEPMAPVRVKTVPVKAGVKVASIGSPANAPSTTSALPSSQMSSVSRKNESRFDMPPQPANHGTGNGVLGVLPASRTSAMAYADVSPRQTPSQVAQPSVIQENGAVKSVVRSGWIVQVGALESEAEARKRLDAARERASGLLDKADRFTETVDKGDKRLYRARFAGLDRGKAEAVCKTLKRSDISCIAIKN